MPPCHIHSDTHFPKEALEVHHKHPTAYGGPDTPDNRCLLCASCHSAVHRIAGKIYSRQMGVAKDIVAQYLPNQPSRQDRLLQLARIIVQARTQHTRSTDIPDAGVDSDDDGGDTVKVSLDMPNWMHHRLKTLSVQTGLYKYILQVLGNHVKVATKKPGASAEELYGVQQPRGEEPPDGRPYLVDFTK